MDLPSPLALSGEFGDFFWGASKKVIFFAASLNNGLIIGYLEWSAKRFFAKKWKTTNPNVSSP